LTSKVLNDFELRNKKNYAVGKNIRATSLNHEQLTKPSATVGIPLCALLTSSSPHPMRPATWHLAYATALFACSPNTCVLDGLPHPKPCRKGCMAAETSGAADKEGADIVSLLRVSWNDGRNAAVNYQFEVDSNPFLRVSSRAFLTINLRAARMPHPKPWRKGCIMAGTSSAARKSGKVCFMDLFKVLCSRSKWRGFSLTREPSRPRVLQTSGAECFMYLERATLDVLSTPSSLPA
jgi:hypothetical protein